MMISNNIFAMIMNEERFKGFTKKEIADTSASAEVIIVQSAKSRDEVDEIGKRHCPPAVHLLGIRKITGLCINGVSRI